MKLVASALFAGAAWSFVSTTWEHSVHNVAMEIAVLAAGVVGAGTLWRYAVRPAWASARTAVKKIDAIWRVVQPFPAWRAHVDRELVRCDQRFSAIEERNRKADERRAEERPGE